MGAIDKLFEHVTAADVAESARDQRHDAGRQSRRRSRRSRTIGFHARLVAIVDNQQINEIYGIMKPVMLKIMENGLARRKFGAGENFGEHASIVDALESRNRLAYQFHMATGTSKWVWRCSRARLRRATHKFWRAKRSPEAAAWTAIGSMTATVSGRRSE